MGVYVALYGSHRVFQERFSEMALKLRMAQGSSQAGDIQMPDGFAHSLFNWALVRMPAVKATPSVEKLSQTLVRAGFIRSAAVRIFQLIRLLSMVGGGMLGFLIGLLVGGPIGRMLLFALIGVVTGTVGPVYYLRRRARKRQAEIARQLSDVLDLLVVCVEAGLGLFEAIKIVGDETDRQGQAIGIELSLVSGEVAAGASLGQALRSLAERTSVDDVKPLAATLIQSEQLGAQIGPALRSSSDSLRTKRRFRAEEAAQKSVVKILFPLVLFVLPAMLIVILAPAMIQAMRTLGGK
jgi:tight adherence protein C